MKTQELTPKERKRLIGRISHASGIARYALAAKMSDEQIVKSAQNLKILSLIKSANDYNRYCQSQKTAEANQKLKQFINIQNSEIYKAGQWLFNCLSQVGQERRQGLLKKDLVHKEDYNQTVVDLRDTISEQKLGVQKQTNEASEKIKNIEESIDSLRKQLQLIQYCIKEKPGSQSWTEINEYIQRNI